MAADKGLETLIEKLTSAVISTPTWTVLVAVERQHGEVGGMPDQDWSLRITLVFRRTPSGWELVHRHADPLVHPIGLDQLSELSRGAAG